MITAIPVFRTRTRIFLSLMLILSAAFYYLTSRIVEDLKPRYRESTEESLADTALVLASVAAEYAAGDSLDPAPLAAVIGRARQLPFRAQIYSYLKVGLDLRVYATDHRGIVVYDSMGRAVGQDYSQWNDVLLTLAGRYGARTTRDNPDDPTTSVLYVAAPIQSAGRTIGVMSVGKPTADVQFFIKRQRLRLLGFAAAAAGAALLPSLLLSWLLGRPIEQLTRYVCEVRDGRRSSIPEIGGGELKQLGCAFEEMREALEGKKYVERYVQSLTHELKSPLSAIRGAAELLESELPEEDRLAFVRNIQVESGRMLEIIQRLLELSALESRRELRQSEEIDVNALCRELAESWETTARSCGLSFRLDDRAGGQMLTERFLLFRALANLLQNALDFTPAGGSVVLSTSAAAGHVVFSVEDTGAGIPQYALGRVFERFYSLARPGTGKKSSGLGLAFVKEVAELHGGSITLKNRPAGGAVAELKLPRHPGSKGEYLSHERRGSA